MKLSYCTECSKSLKKINDTKYTCANGHDYWNNPRGAVAIILVDKGRILVAKRRADPFKGKYDFPGGFLDYGEAVNTAAKREMLEETNLNIGEIEYVDSYTHDYYENTSVCDLLFYCREWSGKPKAKDDVVSLEWKDPGFAESGEFAWSYPGIVAKLKKIL